MPPDAQMPPDDRPHWPPTHDLVRAWEDRERLIKEAEWYHEDILPKARGEAVQMLQAAEAYREQRLIRAQGDSTLVFCGSLTSTARRRA